MPSSSASAASAASAHFISSGTVSTMRSIGWVTMRVGEVLSSPPEPPPPFASPEPAVGAALPLSPSRPEPTGSKAPAPAAGAGAAAAVRPPTAPSAPGTVPPVVGVLATRAGAEAKRLVGLLADLLARGRLEPT